MVGFLNVFYYIFLAFSYSNVTHKIFYLAKIDARDKEKQSLGGGRKMHLFFIRDNLLRDVIFLCFFFRS